MTTKAWSSWSPGARAFTILALGVGGSVAAGLLHLLQLWVMDWGFGGFRWFSREFAWMAPISYGLVIVPGALLLGCVALTVRHRAWLAFSVACVAVVTAFGVLLPLSQLSRAASLVLAAGIGVQAGRMSLAAPERWARNARRWALLGVGVVAVTALLQPRLRAAREGRALAALPAAAPGAPNVLLVVLDAARARSLGFVTPSAGTTPRLDGWAASGVVFEKAFSVAPWTLPSHASMMSGRYAGELGADWTVPIDRDHPVLAELFTQAGYATAGFVANLHYTAWDSGLDRGFVHYDDYQVDAAQLVRSSSFMQTNLADTLLRVPALGNLRAFLSPDLSITRQHRYRSRLGAEVIDAFLGWQTAQAQRPWFAFLNLMDPHLVTSAPDETRRRYPHDARGAADYLAAMRYLDGELDRLLSTLRDRQLLDRTVVIITADHGELLGEHGLEGHARSAYRDVLHVPLLVRYPPRVPAGARIPRAVSLRDLAATVLDLGGLSPGRLPGTSLANAWRDSTAALSPVIAEVRQQPNPLGDYPTATGALSALFDEEWYYIRNHGTGGEQLFHYAADSAEAVDYARASDAAARLQPWRTRLEQILDSRARD